MKKIKEFIIGFLFAGAIFGTVGAFAASGIYNAYINRFPVYKNGGQLMLRGYNIDGNSYFQLRHMSNNLGKFSVEFHDNTVLLFTDGYTYIDYLSDTSKAKKVDAVKSYAESHNIEYGEDSIYTIGEGVSYSIKDINSNYIDIENGEVIYVSYMDEGINKLDKYVVDSEMNCYLIERDIQGVG